MNFTVRRLVNTGKYSLEQKTKAIKPSMLCMIAKRNFYMEKYLL